MRNLIQRGTSYIVVATDPNGKRVWKTIGAVELWSGRKADLRRKVYETTEAIKTGKSLWSFQCGSGHHSGPVTYILDGRQYIAVCVGWGGWTAGFAGDGAPWLRDARRGNTLFVFTLPSGT